MINDHLLASIDAEPSIKQLFVGIGASAGGLEALRSLVAALPTDSNMSYIIAQHMDPKHPSLLRELIARSTSLTVADVTNGLIPQVNTIYTGSQCGDAEQNPVFRACFSHWSQALGRFVFYLHG